MYVDVMISITNSQRRNGKKSELGLSKITGKFVVEDAVQDKLNKIRCPNLIGEILNVARERASDAMTETDGR